MQNLFEKLKRFTFFWSLKFLRFPSSPVFDDDVSPAPWNVDTHTAVEGNGSSRGGSKRHGAGCCNREQPASNEWSHNPMNDDFEQAFFLKKCCQVFKNLEERWTRAEISN